MRPLAAVIAALVLGGTATAATAPKSFVIDGRGWGHGVGMSQWGAEGYALHGWDYRRILGHYYPGTGLQRVSRIRIRVLLADGRSVAVIGSSRPFRVIDERGRSRRMKSGRHGFRANGPPLRFDPGAAPLTLDGYAYRGELRTGGGAVVDVLRLDQYVRGVVPWEMPFYWREAALAAQAVAARTYALAERKPSQRFDVFADTRDQMYGGIRAERASSDRAVALTSGEVLAWGGKPALTYYFSTSGGRTAAVSDQIPGAPQRPYLVPVADPYDSLSPHHRWGPYRFAAKTIAQRLGVPGVRSLAVARNGSGRVAEVLVRWRGGATRVSGGTFAADLELPSNWFVVHGSSKLPSPPTRGVVDGGPAAAPPEPQAWPAGRSGYTVVLDSLPVVAGPAAARAEAARARKDGLSAGVLLSSSFSSLRPGYYVVFSGVYSSSGEAEGAARAAAGSFPSAYARRVAP